MGVTFFLAVDDIFNIVILEEEGKIWSFTNTKFHRNTGMSKTTETRLLIDWLQLQELIHNNI